jgi:hypothetical protein
MDTSHPRLEDLHTSFNCIFLLSCITLQAFQFTILHSSYSTQDKNKLQILLFLGLLSLIHRLRLTYISLGHNLILLSDAHVYQAYIY